MNKLLVIFCIIITAIITVFVMVLLGHKFAKTNTIVIQASSEIENTFLGEYTLTWYCISGTTASGNKTNHELTVAGDLSEFNFNDVLYIKELKKAFVLHDTGGLIKGKRLDIYTNDCEQAKLNGVKKSEVYLIGG